MLVGDLYLFFFSPFPHCLHIRLLFLLLYGCVYVYVYLVRAMTFNTSAFYGLQSRGYVASFLTVSFSNVHKNIVRPPWVINVSWIEVTG